MPAWRDGVDDLRRGDLAADGVERIVRAEPAGYFLDALGDVFGFRVDGMCRAERLGILQLVVEQVGGDDAAGTGQLVYIGGYDTSPPPPNTAIANLAGTVMSL